MICPQCSANLPDKSVFCGKCGKRLSMFSTNQSLKESSPSNIQESDLQLDNTKSEANIAAELDDLVEQIAVSKPNEDTKKPIVSEQKKISEPTAVSEQTALSEQIIVSDKNGNSEKTETSKQKEITEVSKEKQNAEDNKPNTAVKPTKSKAPLNLPNDILNNQPQSPKQDIKIGFSKVVFEPRFKNFYEKNIRKKIFLNFLIVLMPFFILVSASLLANVIPLGYALKVSLVISSIILILSLFIWFISSKAKSWDGEVISKHEEEREKTVKYGSGKHARYERVSYTVYVIQVLLDSEDSYNIVYETDTVEGKYYYENFNEGDRIRYHGKLHYYEKYDKSKDTFVLCPFCKTVNYIKSSKCECGAPLIK